MKTLAAFAVLLVLGVLPARAEDDDKVATLRGELQLLELGRDVDKALLREAMMTAGRAAMGQTAKRPDSEEARKRFAVESAALDEFIKAKSEAVLKRTAVLEKRTAELAAATRRGNRPNQQPKPTDDKDRPGLIEKMEEGQVEVQLLRAKYQMYQQKLNQVLNAVATAEIAADSDETQREKAESARKEFNDFRKKYVDFSKQFQLEQDKVTELRSRLGLPGMSGIGGGFR